MRNVPPDVQPASSPLIPPFARPLDVPLEPLSLTTFGALASLGITSGSICARSNSEHAPVAYVGSFSTCRDLCSAIWPAFDPFDLDEGVPSRCCRGRSRCRHPLWYQCLFRARRPLLRSPCLARSRPALLPSPGPAASISMPAAPLAQAHGSRPPWHQHNRTEHKRGRGGKRQLR